MESSLATDDRDTHIDESDFYVNIPYGVQNLGPYHMAVYGALRRYADRDTMDCWPSHKTIASVAGVGLSKTKEVLLELRDHGWIAWDQRTSDDGKVKHSNKYRVYGHPRFPRVSHGTANPSRVATDPPSHDTADPSHEAAIELHPRNYTQSKNYSDADAPDESAAIIDTHPPHITRLVDLFSDLLTDLGVKHRVGKAWYTDIDRMIRLDGRTHEEVEGAMRWALADHFWQANIHSPAKLRRQYDRLRLQANRPQTQTVDPIRQGLQLAEQLRAQGM